MSLAAFLLWSRLWSLHADAAQLHLAATRHGVPTSVMDVVAAVESGYKGGNNFRGAAGEIGRMQIQPTTARAAGCPEPVAQRLRDYGYNIACGARILRWRYEQQGTWSRAVMAYNRPVKPELAKEYFRRAREEAGRQWFARLDGVMR